MPIQKGFSNHEIIHYTDLIIDAFTTIAPRSKLRAAKISECRGCNLSTARRILIWMGTLDFATYKQPHGDPGGYIKFHCKPSNAHELVMDELAKLENSRTV